MDKKIKVLPFVLLPEVAGEGHEENRKEGAQSYTKPDPELHALTGQRLLLRQGHTPNAQFGFSPHIEQVLHIKTCM